jgi:hypothetical protein
VLWKLVFQPGVYFSELPNPGVLKNVFSLNIPSPISTHIRQEFQVTAFNLAAGITVPGSRDRLD